MDKPIFNKDSKQLGQKVGLFLVKYFNFLTVFLVILILVSGYLFLLKPKYEETIRIVEKNKILADMEESGYNERNKYLGKLNKLIDAYNKSNVSEEDIKKMDAILPKGGGYKETTELMAQMESLVEKNGLILVSLNVSAAGVATGKPVRLPVAPVNLGGLSGIPEEENESDFFGEIKEINITMDVMGTNYLGFKNLLRAIENNLRIINIISLAFSPSGESTSLTMVAYYRE